MSALKNRDPAGSAGASYGCGADAVGFLDRQPCTCGLTIHKRLAAVSIFHENIKIKTIASIRTMSSPGPIKQTQSLNYQARRHKSRRPVLLLLCPVGQGMLSKTVLSVCIFVRSPLPLFCPCCSVSTRQVCTVKHAYRASILPS